MPKRTPREIIEWVGENYTRMDSIQLTDELNRRFGTSMTREAVKCLRYREGFTDAQPRVKRESGLYPPEVREYIKAHVKGTGPLEMSRKVNSEFGTSYTVGQMKSYYGNHGLASGVDGRFQKGHTPANKGVKMPQETYRKLERTMFKKGGIPPNALPVGAEVVTVDGYIRVKTAEPNVWEFKHRLVWQQYKGEIPKGMIINFKDGNPANTDIGNLVMLTRSEHLELTRRGYRSQDPLITGAGVATIKLEGRCRELRSKGKEGGANG